MKLSEIREASTREAFDLKTLFKKKGSDKRLVDATRSAKDTLKKIDKLLSTMSDELRGGNIYARVTKAKASIQEVLDHLADANKWAI